MSDRNDEIVYESDDRVAAPAWWEPSSLLSTEATAIVAFTFAVFSMFGFGSWTLVAQSVLGSPAGPEDLRWQNVLSALVLLLLSLAAILLGKRVLFEGHDGASAWPGQLARAAVVVAAVGAALSLVAILGGLLHGAAGG
jgi:hypothetical protein